MSIIGTNLKLQIRSRQNSIKNNIISGELQKCLSTPVLTNSINFYKRKLWTLNYTMFDSENNSASCLMWNESKAKIGDNYLASAILKWAVINLPETDVWSDNCYGQNNIEYYNVFLFSFK